MIANLPFQPILVLQRKVTIVNARPSTVGRLITSLAFASLCCAPSLAQATSIHFPKFSAPIVQGDHLVVSSPDSRRVLGITLEGAKLWELKFDSPVNLFGGPASEPILQVGKVINTISPGSGKLRARFTVESEDDLVTYSSTLASFVSKSRRSSLRMFKLLDGESGRPVWRTTEIESVIGATPELIVCLAVERIPVGQYHTFGSASLEAYERGSFEKKWSVPLPEESGAPFVPAVFQAPYLFYTDGRTSLSVINCTTGRKQLTKRVELPEFGRISALKLIGGQVAWLTSRYNRDDPSNTEHLLHFCTVPDLDEVGRVVLKLISMSSVAFESGFIISDSLGRTACFRTSGDKVWERFQTARSAAINNRIYFSDYHQKTARVGIVEVSTGKETILYAESVEEPKLDDLFQLDRFIQLDE